MASPFPYSPTQIDEAHVEFHSTTHSLLQKQDAEHSLVAIFLPQSTNRDLSPIQDKLIQLYSGRRIDYPALRIAKRKFLFRLPQYLRMEEVIDELLIWGVENSLYFDFYNPNQGWFVQPPYFRVNLVVLHYPLEFWHPSFFKQLTSSFGCNVYIADGNAKGNDRTSLRLSIRAVDPLRISKTIVILHEERWKRCRVVVKGWYLEGVTSPASPFPWQGGEMQDSEYRGAQDLLQDSALRESMVSAHQIFLLESQGGNGGQPFDADGRSLAKEEGNRFFEARDAPSPGRKNYGLCCPSRRAQSCHPVLHNDKRGRHEWLGCIEAGPVSTYMQHVHPSYCMRGIHMKTTTCTGKGGLSKLQRIRAGAECIQIFSGPLRKGIFPGCKRIEFRHVAPTLIQTRRAPPTKDNFATIPRNPYCCITNTVEKRSRLHRQNQLEPSILGPPPLYNNRTFLFYSKPKQNKPQPLKLIPQNRQAPTYLIPYSPLKKHPTMEKSDEELISKFAGLHTGESSSQIVQIQASEASVRNWEKCLLILVHTDRKVFDTQFERQMRKVWGVSPATVFKPVDMGVYLVQFDTDREMVKVQYGGPWVYRQDLIAVKKCDSVAHLSKSHIIQGEVMVQLHGLPVDSLTPAGISTLLKLLGKVISDPSVFNVDGKPVTKVKVSIPLAEALKDHLTMRHPAIGDTKVYVVYEKIGRVCLFCGGLAHELGSCEDRQRLMRLKAQLADQNRPEMETILEPTFGPWMLDSTLLPTNVSPNPNSHNPTSVRPKRSLNDAFNGSGQQSDAGASLFPEPMNHSASLTTTSESDDEHVLLFRAVPRVSRAVSTL